MPLQGGVVLDVSALDKLLWAKPGIMRAQAGGKLIALDEQTRQQVGGELRFHPSTKRTATIGGFVAGGSAGAGSCMWGSFREPGNVLGLRVVTMEETPRILELRGGEIEKANHAYGTNGIITEVEMPLAPAYDWVDVMMAFPSFMEAARFAEAVTLADGIVKKLATVVASPVPQQYFRHFEGRIPAGMSVALLMIAAPFLEAFEALKAKHGATQAEIYRCPTEEAAVPLYEHSWNHTTLQALKIDRGITYLQTLFPPPGHMALVEKTILRNIWISPKILPLSIRVGIMCILPTINRKQLMVFYIQAIIYLRIEPNELCICWIQNPIGTKNQQVK
jgi:hypothetical protein